MYLAMFMAIHNGSIFIELGDPRSAVQQLAQIHWYDWEKSAERMFSSVQQFSS